MNAAGERLAVDGLQRCHHFGLDFISARDPQEVASVLLRDDVVELVPPGRLPVVVTPNVDQLVHLDRGTDAVAGRMIREATWVLPDGQPIVWGSRLGGERLRSRLAGSSLVAAMWPVVLRDARRACIVASSTETAAHVMADGDGHIVTIVAPMLDLRDRVAFDAFVDTCLDRIVAARAEYVFVTLGYPKRCNVIAGVIDRWPAAAGPLPLFLAVGASFEMYYGAVRRAPRWVQRIGAEWLFRFVQEPRRLFRRYFVDDARFAPMLWREWRAHRAARAV